MKNPDSKIFLKVFCFASFILLASNALALTVSEIEARKKGQVIINEYLASTNKVNVNVYINTPPTSLSIPNNTTIDKRIFGTNLEWFNNAGGLVDQSGIKTSIQDTVQNIKVSRFPGGVLADFYFWENGVGKVVDRVSTRGNISNRIPSTACSQTPADIYKSLHSNVDAGCSRNSFGMPEFFQFLNKTASEGLITVNIVTGSVAEAVNWVLYANKSTPTTQRVSDNSNFTGISANKVKWWEIGNEQYFSNPSCVNSSSCAGQVIEQVQSMTPCQYVGKYNSYVTSMRNAATTPLEFIAIGVATGNQASIVGGSSIFDGITPLWATYVYKETAPAQTSCQKTFAQGSIPPEWNSTILNGAYSNIDYLAVHNGYFPVLTQDDAQLTNENVYKALLAAPEAFDASLNKISATLKTYDASRSSLSKNPIAIAITEWGPLFSNSPNITRWIDHVKTMGSGLFVARMFQVLLKNDRVKIANFFKLTDQSALGWIGYNNVSKVPFEVFKLYASKTGDTRIESSITYSVASRSSAIGNIGAAANVKDVTVFSSKTTNKVYVNLVNRSGNVKLVSINWDKVVTNLKRSGISSDALTANFGVDYASGATPQPIEPSPNKAILQETDIAIQANSNANSTKAELTLKPYSVVTVEGSY